MVEQVNLADYYNFKVLDRCSDRELLREWQLIKSGDYGYESKSSWNKLVKHFQFHEFYKHELDMWNKNEPYQGLPLRSWIYANRKKYIGKGYGELTQAEILRAFKISGIYIGYSFHSPFYIKRFIKDHNIKSIYDPCGGWGHRMLGAAAAGCEYSYNDINVNTYKGCVAMQKFLGFFTWMYNNNAADFTPAENYEAVFTCPPYHNVEVYTEFGAENLDYKAFLDWWRLVVIKSCIAKYSCKYFAFVVNKTYEKDMGQICRDVGLQQISNTLLGSSSSRSHLNSTSSKKEERLLVFIKGN